MAYPMGRLARPMFDPRQARRRRRFQGRPALPGFHFPAQPTGYRGLDDVFAALSDGPMTASQFERLSSGRTPGAEKGRFRGLGSPALQLISKMLQKNQKNILDTSNLAGDELFRAELQNTVEGMRPDTYSLHSGVDESFFTDLLDDMPGAFSPGFNDEGMIRRALIRRQPRRRRQRFVI